jgi:flagellin-like protein
MKGVTPIVATVLLIAMTVITAMGLWYYVTEIASNEIEVPGSEQTRELRISSCDADELYAIVRNTGSSDLNVNADVYNASGVKAGVLNFVERTSSAGSVGLTVGEVDKINITKTVDNFYPGTYRVFDENYSEVTFTCN